MSISVAASATETRVPQSRYERPAANDSAPQIEARSNPVDASGRPAVAGLSALLSQLSMGGGQEGTGSKAADASEPGASEVVKPNLDALNRVLAHYAAQSAAADTMIGIMKP